MRDDTPTVYLLAGPAGPGKTAYARALEAHGVVRLPNAAALPETGRLLVEHSAAGRDVLLEHTLAQAGEREDLQRLVEEHGAQWCLVNFGVDHADLARRLEPVIDPG